MFMASEQRHVAVAAAVLLLMVAVSAAAPTSRSMKAVKEHPSLAKLPSQDVRETGMVKVEGTMNIEVADYPSTGANNNHDPKPPSRV